MRSEVITIGGMHIVIQIAVLILFCVLRPAMAADDSADYDYLVLSLSWSPTYCASDAGRNDHDQCAPGRRFSFVVHGLWPQNERGWPEYCDTQERFVPQSTIDGMLGLMPSKRLVIHEWRKHGTCYGSQRAYFLAIASLHDRIKIPARYIAPQAPIVVTPDQLVDDFAKTNIWLDRDMISVQCGNRRDRANLREIRLCFDRALAPRSCGTNERRSCRARALVLPPSR